MKEPFQGFVIDLTSQRTNTGHRAVEYSVVRESDSTVVEEGKGTFSGPRRVKVLVAELKRRIASAEYRLPKEAGQ